MPPELINEILNYLNNYEIDQCLQSHQIFNVLSLDKYADVKMSNTPLYTYSFVHSYDKCELEANIFGVGRNLRSAARSLILTLVDYFPFTMMEWGMWDDMNDDPERYADHEADDGRKYMYQCFTDKVDIDNDILAQHVLDSIDFSRWTTDDVVKYIGNYFDDSYWEDGWWIDIEETRLSE